MIRGRRAWTQITPRLRLTPSHRENSDGGGGGGSHHRCHMGATRLILAALDCPEAIHRDYYLNMFLSNHTDGSLENILFNLLPK